MQIAADDNDQQTLLFTYPAIENENGSESDYISKRIRLEFGARGDIHPNEEKVIFPYIADVFPELVEMPQVNVPTLKAERTFWEKVTLLHSLYHGEKMRDRMSRHYYDMYKMFQSSIFKKAANDAALLEMVVANKSLLFKDNKASYDTACRGSLRLVPHDGLKQFIAGDYKKMEVMFMEEPPSFEEVMKGIGEMEGILNDS